MKYQVQGDLAGGAIESNLEAIRRRVQTAEYAAVHVCNNPGVWGRYYADSTEDSRIQSDFKYLLRYCEELISKNADLRYQLEAAGIDPDKRAE